MTRGRSWLTGGGRSSQLAVLFAAVVGPPALALVWLGWQFAQHDRSLLREREEERREVAERAIVLSLDQSLSEAETHLSGGSVPDGMVRFVVTPEGLSAEPSDHLLWHPKPPHLLPMESRLFTGVEVVELRNGALGPALLKYRHWSASPDPSVRAGALVRVARIHRQQMSSDLALAAYRQLTAITTVELDGMPLDLLARRQICSVLEETAQVSELAREADSIERDLVSGHWHLDRDAWDLVTMDLRRWTGRDLQVSEERTGFSQLAAALLEQAPAPPANPTLSSGRMILTVEGTTFTLLRAASGPNTSILAVAPSRLLDWVTRAANAAPSKGAIQLVTDAGQTIASSSAADVGGVAARVAEAKLPWTIVFSSAASSEFTGELTSRRRLLLSGLGAILLLLGGGSYVLWRVMQRELVVSRLQTEFVAAVSHEFRTPLTSVKHLTDLLAEHDDMPGEKRRDFYAAIGRSTNRLQRLVESLLDFSRMDSGRKPYDLRVVNVTAVISELVEEFMADIDPARVHLDFRAGEDPILARADRSALTHAIRNLLDNAAKYSPMPATISVSIRRDGDSVAVTVTDSGIGVPKQERGDIFRRFVRGEEAVRLGIQGTGLGLAMVSHIVTAHHGRIELESEEGRGSAFTFVIPALPSESLTELGDLGIPIIPAAFKES